MIGKLMAAQQILLRESAGSPETRRVLAALEKDVPAPVLAHFLRLIAQGRKGVGEVRSGVCSACHLRVASAIVAALREPEDLHVCEHCGCYLLLAPEEVAATAVPVARSKRRRPSAVAV